MASSDDEEIKRAVEKLIADHGGEATLYASKRLADVRRGGDAEIIAYWRDVISALNKIPKNSN